MSQLLTETDPLGRETSYEYDDLGRLTKTTLPDPDDTGPLTLPECTYTYDAIGNLLTETDPLGNTTTHAYDDLYRTTEERWKDGVTTVRTIAWQYAAAGQVTSIDDDADHDYTYDDLGRAYCNWLASAVIAHVLHLQMVRNLLSVLEGLHLKVLHWLRFRGETLLGTKCKVRT